MHVYFVATDKSTAETEAIKRAKPDRILGSYFYFRTKGIKQFIEKIGYKPDFFLDSGAYSAWSQGKPVNIEKYMEFIKDNSDYINKYIALDVFGDGSATYDNYVLMRDRGFKPVPVYHYKTSLEYLEAYITAGEKYIALGGTVPIKQKEIVVKWINDLNYKYPEIKFHLLGSSSAIVTINARLYSCDSSTWILSAVNGKSRTNRGRDTESKIQRATDNIKFIQERGKHSQTTIFDFVEV